MIDTFPIVPPTSRGPWIVVGLILLILVPVVWMLFTTAFGASGSRFELSSEGLTIRGDLYGRRIPASALRGGSARIVDLRTEKDLQPRFRTMGTAVPGYRAGWFRLPRGKKALLYVTDGSRAVHVPTTAGYDLLLSPRDPERFVERLRAIAPQE